MIRSVLAKIYNKIFPSRKIIKQLKLEKQQLETQVEYLKTHSDITKLLPATGELREFQLNNLYYVKETISLIKQEIDINTFMEGGGLLGKVRHNGYIPWDDDLDFSVLRSDFEKIIEYCKTHFYWADVRYIENNSYVEFDKIIREHQNEYVAILTPYCLHIYKGTDINHVYNLEFFPWDFVKPDVTQDQIIAFSKEYKSQIESLHTWPKVFDYLENEEVYNRVFTKKETAYISPGVGHWDMAKLTIRGYHLYSDIFPLKEVDFEGVKIFIPNKPEKYLSLVYGNYMDYPDDFGVSHNFEEIKQTVNTENESN